MVFVKVREVYDLQTVKNKLTVIGIHTPKPKILKDNFPGLLMQCKAYRPVSADVRIACASSLPLDPLGVGLNDGDVAPEDMFNPILYKATSNFGMSQIEARIVRNSVNDPAVNVDIAGNTADIDVDGTTSFTDEFSLYYGLLSNAHEWRHANPQSGLEMTDLKPYVYEVLANIGDQAAAGTTSAPYNYGAAPSASGGAIDTITVKTIRGNAKPIPWINCTSYSSTGNLNPFVPSGSTDANVGFREQDVPYINVVCGCIIIPPSKLHELFFRMVVEWTIEFSTIRPLGEVTSFGGLQTLGTSTHYQNYSYPTTKEALTGDPESIMDNDMAMVSSNVEVKKVM